MEKNAKIYIAGMYGMVGNAIARSLRAQGYTNILGHSSKELDLTNQTAVFDFFKAEKPDYVFLAAAKVGGIYANNTYPADFIYSNMCIQTNIIHSSYIFRVRKLLFLGSSCIYPKFAEQPMKESCLLTGELEPTNEPYALAKIAGIKMCQAYNRQYHTSFISCMPTNLYGPNDNYDLMNAHVLPALIRKVHEAKSNNQPSFIVWGTGSPKREFLYVDDLAEACVFLMNEYLHDETINVGSGQEVTIKELAETVRDVVGFKGELVFDHAKPDGSPRKLLDDSRLKSLGWSAKTTLKKGIEKAYADFLEGKVRM
ncbi:MAG: GDP-L-fucose synthase [Fibrobacterota bacterium]|nr:GDP-L-fucose synthase [Fibrobacterota bacterium]